MGWPGARLTYASCSPIPPDPTLTIGSLRSGYQQLVDPATAPATGASIFSRSAEPVLAAHDPAIGFLLPGRALPAVPHDQQNYYVAASVGDRLGHAQQPGGFAIGRSAIGHRRPTHDLLTPGAAPGQPEVEAPATP